MIGEPPAKGDLQFRPELVDHYIIILAGITFGVSLPFTYFILAIAKKPIIPLVATFVAVFLIVFVYMGILFSFMAR